MIENVLIDKECVENASLDFEMTCTSINKMMVSINWRLI